MLEPANTPEVGHMSYKRLPTQQNLGGQAYDADQRQVGLPRHLLLIASLCGLLIVSASASATTVAVWACNSACSASPGAPTLATTARARSAVLRGAVDPRRGVTQYRFQYTLAVAGQRFNYWRDRPAFIGITIPTARTGPARTRGAAARRMLWGAELGTQFTGGQAPWDMSAVSVFQRMVGKAPSILPFNIPFIDCSGKCTWYWFPSRQMDAIRAYGSIPMINWSSMSSPLHVTEPGFKLIQVIKGKFDTYLRAFAEAAKAWGHPFFLRFNWEMNGNWFPWAAGANGNRPAQSAAAWRHVHDIFTSVGATNVDWVWCPSITTTNATIPLPELYPGNAYVNWTCLDGYNWGTSGPHGWQSFSQVFTPSYRQITGSIAPSKPLMIGETGANARGGSKPAWISHMFSSLATGFSSIHALLWFDVQDGQDWPLESSVRSRQAFVHGISAERFQANDNSALGGTAIAGP